MPELPDITVYVEALVARLRGQVLHAVEIRSPFVLRSVEPAPQTAVGARVVGVSRIGKRIVIAFEGDLYFVLHLMIAGRLRWRPVNAPSRGKIDMAAFRFGSGTLVLTEAASKKRASLHVVAGAAGLTAFDRGGLEPVGSDIEQFREALRRENHTVKRALTDPHLFSGIGNAYSDEILHRARMSPFKQTHALDDDETVRLHHATLAVLAEWTERLRRETGDAFPEKVTAFREGMAVHGRFRQPCPDCGTPVQRIVYAENEANYCARCQTGGRLLADRALSQLLRSDWPKTVEELEERRQRDRA